MDRPRSLREPRAGTPQAAECSETARQADVYAKQADNHNASIRLT